MSSATETFKEPFLGQVKEVLGRAVSITWEGCHKIYICLDQESHDQQKEWGYQMTMVTDKEEALEQLYRWFNVSCGLRFISAIADCTYFIDVIAQFDYDADADEEEE